MFLACSGTLCRTQGVKGRTVIPPLTTHHQGLVSSHTTRATSSSRGMAMWTIGHQVKGAVIAYMAFIDPSIPSSLPPPSLPPSLPPGHPPLIPSAPSMANWSPVPPPPSHPPPQRYPPPSQYGPPAPQRDFFMPPRRPPPSSRYNYSVSHSGQSVDINLVFDDIIFFLAYRGLATTTELYRGCHTSVVICSDQLLL